MIWIVIIAFAVVGFIAFGKAVKRAEDLLDGSPPASKRGLVEGWAEKLIPTIEKDRAKKDARTVKKRDGRKEPRYLQFEYADKYGRTKVRQIRNWTEDRYYVEGYDLDKMGHRTFSKEKIVAVLNDTPVIPKGLNRKYSFVQERPGRVAIVGKSPPAPPGRYGEPIQGPVIEPLAFQYRYRDGTVGFHSLRDWYEYEKHVSGWCTEYDESRVFAKRQVAEWFGDAESRLS